MEIVKGRAMLIKFKNEEIIDSLRGGCIYMNSLKRFREIEKTTDDDKVGDWLDGLMHINDGFLIIEEPQPTVEPLKDAGLLTKYSNDYCYCFFGMNETNYHEYFTDEQKLKFEEMGDYALVILDYEELMRRIITACDGKGYEIYGGFVNYYDPSVDTFNVKQLLMKDGLKTIPLLKRNKYRYQQEFRIVIHSQKEKDDHIELQIGDISDITKKLKAGTILNAAIRPANETRTGGN